MTTTALGTKRPLSSTTMQAQPLIHVPDSQRLAVAACPDTGMTFTIVKSACMCCRKSRVKCDKSLPCSRCRRLGLQCRPQMRGRGRPPVNRSASAAQTNNGVAAVASSSGLSSATKRRKSDNNKNNNNGYNIKHPAQLTISRPSQHDVLAWALQHASAANQPRGHSASPPPTPFCRAVQVILARVCASNVADGSPVNAPTVAEGQRYLQILWHIAAREHCSYLENAVTQAAAQFGLSLDTQAQLDDGATAPAAVSAAVQSIPRERHLRGSWDTPDAAYWERTVFMGHSSYHSNRKWSEMFITPEEAKGAIDQNQGDLLSLVVHRDDLAAMFESLTDVHVNHRNQGSTATNVARLHLRGQTQGVGVISTSLFVSADGRLAHLCVRIKLADARALPAENGASGAHSSPTAAFGVSPLPSTPGSSGSGVVGTTAHASSPAALNASSLDSKGCNNSKGSSTPSIGLFDEASAGATAASTASSNNHNNFSTFQSADNSTTNDLSDSILNSAMYPLLNRRASLSSIASSVGFQPNAGVLTSSSSSSSSAAMAVFQGNSGIATSAPLSLSGSLLMNARKSFGGDLAGFGLAELPSKSRPSLPFIGMGMPSPLPGFGSAGLSNSQSQPSFPMLFAGSNGVPSSTSPPPTPGGGAQLQFPRFSWLSN